MKPRGRLHWILTLLMPMLASSAAWAQIQFKHSAQQFPNAYYEEKQDPSAWKEGEVTLPPFPKEARLKPFFVSGGTNNRFSVDLDSISVHPEGVVRYSLVVETAGGARNVSYEGMRCRTRERRAYAFGRVDGTWANARSDAWTKITEKDTNRHHAALFLGYFCPDGVIVVDKEEALQFFAKGGKDYQSRGF